MGDFGGKKHGLAFQAKGPGYYRLTEDDLRDAWERYHQGVPVYIIVNNFVGRCWPPRRLSLKKLIVEWGAMGLPVWAFGRRGKIRRETQRLLTGLQERFDMPLTPTMFAALKLAEAQGADLRAIVEAEFGAAPRRPSTWAEKEFGREHVRKLRERVKAVRLEEKGAAGNAP